MAPESTPQRNGAARARRGHGRVTLQDVAAAAGVTKITVSRYLRQPGLVAGDTAARIASALADTGYVPNKQAGMLASGRSRVVAAIVPNLANSVFAETLQGLADGLQGAHYELLLASSDYSLQREEEQIRTVLGWLPAALVVTGRHHSPGALALLRGARSAGVPVIEIWDRQARGAEFTQVGFDHAEVGRAMARHLRQAGYRRLAYVDSGVAADFRAHERGAAFAAEAPGTRVLVAPPGDAFDAGRAALATLIDGTGRRPRVDAIAFSNDRLACGAWLEAQRLGLAVPGDLALMGFGDFAISRQLGEGITSVRLPRYAIGAAASQAVLAQLNAAASEAVAPAGADVDLAWAVVPRGSSRPRPPR